MKDDYRGMGCCLKSEPSFQIVFTASEMKDYYKSIKNDRNISDGFKLKIANFLLDNKII
jgi:hypothetical protein